MTTRFASSEGFVTERVKDYYAARSRGGVGLIIVEAATVDSPEGKGFDHQLAIDDDRFVSGLRELVEAIHAHGAKAALQLHHVGARGRSSVTGRQLVAPSAVGFPRDDPPRPLREEEIERLVGAFATAAERAKAAGFDAIEVHAAHGYLLSTFLSPVFNQRQDRYGGSNENRGRFLVEVLEAILRSVGPECPVWPRVGADVAPEFAGRIEGIGAHALHISAPLASGNPDTPPMGEPEGALLPVAEEVKRRVGIPIITVARIEPELAEQAMRDSKTDLVAFGRPLLADPEMPRKLAAGALGTVRPCIRCGTCMHTLLTAPNGVQCAVNPAAGHERELAIVPAKHQRNVAVVGGGPAGMEAARVAAIRGHNVTVYERSDRLGGQLLLAQVPPYKGILRRIIQYHTSELKRLGVTVVLETTVTSDLMAADKPDAVILCTGAEPFVPSIPGIDGVNTVLAWDLLNGRASAGRRVVTIGGELTACEVADMLAEADKEVVITTMERDILTTNVVPGHRSWLVRRLAHANIAVYAGVRYTQIREAGLALVEPDGTERLLKADTIVIAAGARPRDGLRDSLQGAVDSVTAAGDCIRPRDILHALEEGYRAALSV